MRISDWSSDVCSSDLYIMAVRAEVPAPSMDDEDRTEWDRILNPRHPYNDPTRDGDDRTRISGIVGATAGADPCMLYSVPPCAEAKQPQEARQAKLALLLDGSENKEKGQTRRAKV